MTGHRTSGREPSGQHDHVVSLFNQGRYAEAERAAAALAEADPHSAFAWRALAATLSAQGRYAEALQPMRTAVQLNGDAESHNNLGLVLQESGQPQEAEASFRTALRLKPGLVEAHANLGRNLLALGRLAEAEERLRRALALNPAIAEVHNTLGAVLQESGRYLEAAECFRQALGLSPGYTEALTAFGATLCALGQLNDAEACFRKVLQVRPNDAAAFSNLLFVHNYGAARSPDECVAEARLYGQAFGKVEARFGSWPQATATERLRVGFISADLHNHPVGYFIESLLAHLDASKFELFAYPTRYHHDALTDRIRPRFAAWRLLAGRTDQEAARLIHGDGIHVLIDLSGHTAHNRLPVFAFKPAPVQVTWLGYFATTGVAEIDYVLADAVSVPPAHRDHFTEEVWYLPDTRLCFTAPDVEVAVAPLPAQANRFVTFASFQNLAKLGDEVLALWGRILAAMPDARLRVQNKQLADAGVRERLIERLRRAGIAAERVSLHGPMPRREYLAAHNEVDLILDTFPYPGGTTTCEALWMGVPTLTLAGDRLIARQGASLLAAAGLAEWVAESQQQYVEKALAFARDLQGLAALRGSLRDQVLGSPLFDAPRFARNFEAALREMWQRHTTKPAT